MRCFNRIGFGAVAAVAIALATVGGCKSSGGVAMDGTAGTGGQTGVDSASERPSDGAGAGAHDGAAPDAEAGTGAGGCLGACLEAFLAQCSEVGQSCTTATSGSEVINCYANGVKQAKVVGSSGTTVVVQTSGAQTCYESDLTGTNEVIKDLIGKTIAQIAHTSPTQLTVDCYGVDGSVVTTQVDLTAPACAATHASMTQTCTAGTCTF